MIEEIKNIISEFDRFASIPFEYVKDNKPVRSSVVIERSNDLEGDAHHTLGLIYKTIGSNIKFRLLRWDEESFKLV